MTPFAAKGFDLGRQISEFAAKFHLNGQVRHVSMIRKTVDVLGVKIDRLSMRECVERLVKAVEGGERLRVVTANPEMVYLTLSDRRLREVINSADLVTPDGVGIVWAAKYLGRPVPERVTGIDLVEALLPHAHRGRWRVFFLGSAPGVGARAIEKLRSKYPGIAWDYEHGYFSRAEEPAIVARIRAFQPQLLLVGLGVPRQEYWLADHPGLAKVSIGVGGSFDTLAGDKPRAPKWIQDLKLEWLYRLALEPKRLKRQRVLPLFVIEVMKQRLHRS